MPAPLDETETYKSTADAVFHGAVLPEAGVALYDKITGKPKTMEGRMGRRSMRGSGGTRDRDVGQA